MLSPMLRSMRTIKRTASPLETFLDAWREFFASRAKELTGFALVIVTGATTAALATWSVLDPSLNNATNAPVKNVLGWPGAIVSDLAMQLFGLSALALLLPPALWGWRLLRKGKLDHVQLRLILWIVGFGAASAVASSLPATDRWPLPTGLGGVTGDGVLNTVKTILGIASGSGGAMIGFAFAAVAILSISAACGVGLSEERDAFADDEDPLDGLGPSYGSKPRVSRVSQRTDWEDADEAADQEPGWGIISLGAAAHAFMSIRTRLRKRRESKALEKRNAEQAALVRAERAAPWMDGAMERSATDRPAMAPARQMQGDRRTMNPAPARLEPSFGMPSNQTVSARPSEFANPLRPDRASPPPAVDLHADDNLDDGDFDALSVDALTPEPPQAAPAQAEAWKSPLQEFTRAGRRQAASPPAPAPLPAEQPTRVAAVPQAVKPGKRILREAQPSFLEQEDYQFPPLDLLSEPKGSNLAAISADALEQNAALLESTLEDFGVRGEIINVRPGPVVTLYELEPAPGTKSSRVISLADDIARSMSAVSARVAVVQGRNVIGIELPNAKRDTVFLRELLASKDFESTKHKLALCLGKTIGGETVIVDLARMPHVLIAGTTGSGKSVAINTMILSLLYRLTPEQCRLIMVDPKMLELSVYEGIPHLLTPVVTDPKKAVVALKWAVREMEDRYKKMSKLGVRNIDGFNTRISEAKAKNEIITRTVQTGFDKGTGEAIYEEEEMDLEPLPYIVVIVDEMADLMLVAGKEIEGTIQRLAQMARAAGIHVVLATQRPSVDVITGTIKANFPTRVSFQVTSKIDSRTILGEQGAEQLLGQGDMLYMAAGGRLTRVHGPFCSDDEVEKVVAHLKRQGRPKYLEAVTASEEEEAPDTPVMDQGSFGSPGNDLYDQAVAIVLRDKKASTSYIQRRLQIGYNRAATLMERMEQEGIVGAPNHAGKREILLESPPINNDMDDE